MKIHNWEKFNERLSEETLKSAEDKAREYGDEETANKFKKHNYMSQNKENIITLFKTLQNSLSTEELIIDGVDVGASFDMWKDDSHLDDAIISLPFFFVSTLTDERIDMWISFETKENRLKFGSVDFIDGDGQDVEFRFPIQEAKKAIEKFKEMINAKSFKLSRRPSHHPSQLEDINIFTEYLEEISSKLNYRMLPLHKK